MLFNNKYNLIRFFKLPITRVSQKIILLHFESNVTNSAEKRPLTLHAHSTWSCAARILHVPVVCRFNLVCSLYVFRCARPLENGLAPLAIVSTSTCSNPGTPEHWNTGTSVGRRVSGLVPQCALRVARHPFEYYILWNDVLYQYTYLPYFIYFRPCVSATYV